jgi:hypothetical protein
MELMLTEDEERLLAHLLEERHRELLHEISKTDHHEFRELLRQREALLSAVLAKLGAGQAVRG